MKQVAIDAMRAKVVRQRAKALKKNYRLLRAATAVWHAVIAGHNDPQDRAVLAHLARQIARENNFPLPPEFAA